METIKQIVYRDSDTALMIIPDQDVPVVPRFVNELTDSQEQVFIDLRTFCLTQVNEISYVVYTTDIDRLDIQGTDDTVVCLIVNELDPADKNVVDAALQECVNLLNS